MLGHQHFTIVKLPIDYFECHYAKRKEQWATCYRKEASINTNMYVEAFHQVLKYVYLKGKVNKRLDNCIGILLKLARDKGFERIAKMEKGKISERITQIRIRHKKLPFTSIKPTTAYCTWEVHSVDGKNTYIVAHINEVCPYNCAITCSDFRICLHMYSCDCTDALIRASMQTYSPSCATSHTTPSFLNTAIFRYRRFWTDTLTFGSQPIFSTVTSLLI